MAQDSDKTVTTSIRIPESLLERVKELAKAEDRSMNWMLVDLIREALERRLSE